MKSLYSFTLAVVLGAPIYAASPVQPASMDDAGLTSVCGAVPEAPAKVRQASRPEALTRKGKAFLRDVDAWLTCSEALSVSLQYQLDDMPEGDAKTVTIATHDADFAAQYELLNAELLQFEQRANATQAKLKTSNIVNARMQTRCTRADQMLRQCFDRNGSFQSPLGSVTRQRLAEPVTVQKQTPPTFGR
ncbi:hypothetical protein [Kordiimonas gwangyangensis]|uniref:hypothetical protein n=1 Tax=Kordiimonas gwangyangensis TaxID=288022 RepID=UPI000364E522|nr:hypothetical protein [Kordiimonas gwangyangensis]